MFLFSVDPKPVPIPGVVPPNPINPVSTSTSATTLHSTVRIFLPQLIEPNVILYLYILKSISENGIVC